MIAFDEDARLLTPISAWSRTSATRAINALHATTPSGSSLFGVALSLINSKTNAQSGAVAPQVILISDGAVAANFTLTRATVHTIAVGKLSMQNIEKITMLQRTKPEYIRSVAEIGKVANIVGRTMFYLYPTLQISWGGGAVLLNAPYAFDLQPTRVIAYNTSGSISLNATLSFTELMMPAAMVQAIVAMEVRQKLISSAFLKNEALAHSVLCSYTAFQIDLPPLPQAANTSSVELPPSPFVRSNQLWSNEFITANVLQIKEAFLRPLSPPPPPPPLPTTNSGVALSLLALLYCM